MTVLEGEAVALLEALHFADANRRDRVVLETDSSTLVQALSFPGYDVWNSTLLFLVLFISYFYIPTSR